MATALPRVDHLMLLVGGNPLPNAVAGRLLVAEKGTVSLVHSAKTARVARLLRQWLVQQQPAPRVRFKEVDESDPVSILGGVRAELHAIKCASVGLHYTGGTKAMSVHAYRGMERWAGEQGAEPVFSYLDARTLELVFDPTAPESGQSTRREYVGRALTMRVDDLMRLHGWRLQQPMRPRPLLPATARELARVAADDGGARAWNKWKQDVLYPSRDQRAAFPLPADPLLRDATAALQQELSLGPRDRVTPDALAREGEDIYGWLDGLWLESAVLQGVLDCQTRCGLDEAGLSLRPAAGSGLPTKFEFDVAAVRGYQLFACSCSIKSDHGSLKHKLFEAYIRAHQLGGDEARLALVCCSDRLQPLEDEVRRDIDPEGRTRVFGRRHLGNLAAHLEQWVRDQSGSEEPCNS